MPPVPPERGPSQEAGRVHCLALQRQADFSVSEGEKTAPQMRFYYPDESETLWDICKKFGVSRADIANGNNITDGKLPEVLIIPLIK